MLAAGTEHARRARRRARVRDPLRGGPARASTPAARSRVRHMILGAAATRTLVRAVGQLPRAVPAADSRRRSVARPRTGAQPAARRRRRPARRLLDLAPRAGAGCRGRGSTSAAPPGASSRSSSDQDNALAYADPEPGSGGRDRRVLRAARWRRQRRPRPVRDRRRQQRRARRQAAVADVEERRGCARSTSASRSRTSRT